jgi:uncharacterized protein YbaR (Trm112 family)
MIHSSLKQLLACPVTKAPVHYHEATEEWVCLASRLAYPTQHGIPVMLEEAARVIGQDEYEQLSQLYRTPRPS